MASSKTTWRDQLEEARALRKKGAGLTYQRALKLREVYKSEGFMEHCAEVGRSKEDILNDEVGDLCCKFKVLMSALDAYPRKSQWEGQRLDQLVAKAIASQAEQNEARRESRPRVSWKQKYEELEAQYDALLQKYNDLRSHLPKQERVAS